MMAPDRRALVPHAVLLLVRQIIAVLHIYYNQEGTLKSINSKAQMYCPVSIHLASNEKKTYCVNYDVDQEIHVVVKLQLQNQKQYRSLLS